MDGSFHKRTYNSPFFSLSDSELLAKNLCVFHPQHFTGSGKIIIVVQRRQGMFGHPQIKSLVGGQRTVVRPEAFQELFSVALVDRLLELSGNNFPGTASITMQRYFPYIKLFFTNRQYSALRTASADNKASW